MVEIKKAFFFNFGGDDILKAHLFEHCLAAYFRDHDIPYVMATTLPLGMYFLFDKEPSKFPSVPDLNPYIDNQKKRVNLELLEEVDSRLTLIEMMHKLSVEDYADLLKGVEGILMYDSQELLKLFGRIMESKLEVTGLTAKLPEISPNTSFKPTKHQICIPKLNQYLDVLEVAVRVPHTLDNFCCFVNVGRQARESLRKTEILGDVVYGHYFNVNTLQDNSLYFTFSLKTRSGSGLRAKQTFLDFFRNFVMKEEDFDTWKGKMIEKVQKEWQEGKLTDLLATELVLWRRILKPEDFAAFNFHTISDLYKQIFSSPDSFYFLTDF